MTKRDPRNLEILWEKRKQSKRQLVHKMIMDLENNLNREAFKEVVEESRFTNERLISKPPTQSTVKPDPMNLT